jgi:hypothetical protein
MPIFCSTFACICLFFRHPPVSQGGWGFEGVVPELVHSLDPAIWGQTSNAFGNHPLAATQIDSDNAPKIASWMSN